MIKYLVLLLLLTGCAQIESSDVNDLEVATFAGGCFWCTEADFEKLDGVKEVISGYAGGSVENPTYKQVSSGNTGHIEAVQVYYDENEVSYEELLNYFWRHVNPTDAGGQFVDRGNQYVSAIFYANEKELDLIEQSKEELESLNIFDKPIVTRIIPLTKFYEAEEYHQNYYKENSLRYNFYRKNSGRDEFLDSIWKVDLTEKLTPLQYHVTQEEGTEPPFNNEYWNNTEEGIYVDLISGDALFSSTDKFKSGTGWPSFTKPIDGAKVIEKKDYKLIIPRTEVRSTTGHLGHIFNDGPAPDYIRYCLNSASLRFVAKENLVEEGYEEYLYLFSED